MEATDKTAGKSIGIIILAAGKSSRLGQPKQLLEYRGQTLLQHSLQVALASDARPVVVVLGADADRIKKEITDDAAHVVENREWEEGMASSIRCGIRELQQLHPAAEGAMVMVCDQPYVTSALLNRLLAIHRETDKPIVSCQYANTVGTPAYFHKSMFAELLELEGDGGAKGLLLKHAEGLEIVQFPEGKVDIDTEADYRNLKREG